MGRGSGGDAPLLCFLWIWESTTCGLLFFSGEVSGIKELDLLVRMRKDFGMLAQIIPERGSTTLEHCISRKIQ